MDYNERTYTQQHVYGADFLSKTVNCVHNGINVSIIRYILGILKVKSFDFNLRPLSKI